MSNGTASLADLLTNARAPLAGTVDQLNRVAPLLDQDKDRIDVAMQKAPDNYRKLTRLGAYGASVPYYLCGLSLRVTDLQGRTVVAPWFNRSRKVRGALMLKYRGAASDQGRIHRRCLDGAGHRGRSVARPAGVVGDDRSNTRRCSPKPAALPPATT